MGHTSNDCAGGHGIQMSKTLCKAELVLVALQCGRGGLLSLHRNGIGKQKEVAPTTF